MGNVRVIARLDIKGPNLVKGIHLEGLRVLGKPEDFAQYYYESGADEIMYQDVVASLYERNSLSEIIARTVENVFIPLTVGGGIRTIEDINKVLRAGADKVSINTAAIKSPEFIKQAAEKFGSSTILISIECIKQQDGSHLVFVDNGREHTGVEVVEWAQKVQELGAGEIVLTSVDRDGTGLGFDLDLIGKVSSVLKIPLIVHGGAGRKENIEEVLKEPGVDAVALASILHYDYIKRSKEDNSSQSEGNTNFLKSGRTFGKIDAMDIKSIKQYLLDKDISCRI